MACYFKKKGSKIESTADIEGFLDIKYDDQKLIKDLMSGSATLSPPPAKKGAEAKGGGGASNLACLCIFRFFDGINRLINGINLLPLPFIGDLIAFSILDGIN